MWKLFGAPFAAVPFTTHHGAWQPHSPSLSSWFCIFVPNSSSPILSIRQVTRSGTRFKGLFHLSIRVTNPSLILDSRVSSCSSLRAVAKQFVFLVCTRGRKYNSVLSRQISFEEQKDVEEHLSKSRFSEDILPPNQTLIFG